MKMITAFSLLCALTVSVIFADAKPGNDSFLKAVERGNVKAVELMLKKGADINATSVEPADVRTVNTDFTPEYFTDEIQAQAHLDHSFGTINLGLTGIYQRTRVDSRQDYNLDVASRAPLQQGLNSLAFLAANGIPGLPGTNAYFAPIAAALIPTGPAGNVCTSNTKPNGLGVFGGDGICAATPLAFDRSVAKNESWAG